MDDNSIPKTRWPFWDHEMLMFGYHCLLHNVKPDMGIVLCLSPARLELLVKQFQFKLWFFNFVICIGMTAVKSSLILTLIFLLIGSRFLWWIFVSLSNETETVWANSFILNFGLVYLILFLDERSPTHLQIISCFVANFVQRSNLLLIGCCRSQHLKQQISFILFVFGWLCTSKPLYFITGFVVIFC